MSVPDESDGFPLLFSDQLHNIRAIVRYRHHLTFNHLLNSSESVLHLIIYLKVVVR